MTRSAALRQVVEPDFWTTPDGPRARPVRTYGPAVADLCASAEFAPDPQQELALDWIFAVDDSDRPVSFSTWLICARQNLKTGVMIQAAIGWIYLDDVREVMWTAHEAKTAADSQESLFEVLQQPALSSLLPVQKNLGLYDENGDERVEFNTGQKIRFRTRTKNGARGIARVQKLLVDEAAWLQPRQQGAMFPVVAAKRGLGQILGASSAGPIEANLLRSRRDRGRIGVPRSTWLEWLADQEPCGSMNCKHPQNALDLGIDCALDREHLILQANPSIERDEEGRALNTGRIQVQTVRDLRGELEPEEAMRELFGWWEEPDQHRRLITSQAWNALRVEQGDPAARIVRPRWFGLDVAEDLSFAAIGVAGARVDGRMGVELTSEPIVGVEDARQIDYRPGVDWAIDRAAEIAKRWRGRFAIASGSAAMGLLPRLKKAGVPVDVVKHADLPPACTRFVSLGNTDQLRHLGQTPLNVALDVARKRNVGDGAWAYGRRVSDGDILALWAVTLPLWQEQANPAPVYDLTKTIG